jgi:hypothetical protein
VKTEEGDLIPEKGSQATRDAVFTVNAAWSNHRKRVASKVEPNKKGVT